MIPLISINIIRMEATYEKIKYMPLIGNDRSTHKFTCIVILDISSLKLATALLDDQTAKESLEKKVREEMINSIPSDILAIAVLTDSDYQVDEWYDIEFLYDKGKVGFEYSLSIKDINLGAFIRNESRIYHAF